MKRDDDHPVDRGAGPHGSHGDGSVELRTTSAVTIGWVSIAAAVVVAILVVIQVPMPAAISMLGLPAFIAVLGWACYLRPRVHLRNDGMRIVNILRIYDVPFARVVDIDRRLGVTLETDVGKKIGVWSLPNTGRRTRREGLSRGVVEPHTPTEVESVVTAHEKWHAEHSAIDSGHHDTSSTAVITRIEALPLTLCVITVLWALWGLGFSSAL